MAEHHPAVRHQQRAAEHLQRAVDDLRQANEHHAHGEHHVAAEVSKQAIGRVQEAGAHLAEAQRLHRRHQATSTSDQGAPDEASQWDVAEERDEDEDDED